MTKQKDANSTLFISKINLEGIHPNITAFDHHDGDIYHSKTNESNATLGFNIAGRIVKINQDGDVTSESLVVNNTALLLHFNGINGSTIITDSSLNGHVVTAIGAAQIETSQSVFGGASGHVSPVNDATTDWFEVENSEVFFFDSNDFTIDFRLRLDSTPEFIKGIYVQSDSSSEQIILDITASSSIRFIVRKGGVIVIRYEWPYDSTPNIWNHVAIERDGTSMRLFVNGVEATAQVFNAADTISLPNLNSNIKIGATTSPRSLEGWLDEYRVSRIKRYTGNFTPNINEYVAD